jgi:arsenate reductase
MEIIIYQKTTCSKCQKLIEYMANKENPYKIINYYEKRFSSEELESILCKLSISPRELMRDKELLFKELGIDEKKYTHKELVDFLITYPDLIQRPLVVYGDKAIVARPLEKIKEIL